MGVGFRDVVFLGVVVGGTGLMAAGSLRPSASSPAQPSQPLVVRSDDRRTIVDAVDTSFRDRSSGRGDASSRREQPRHLSWPPRRLPLVLGGRGALAGRDSPL